MQTTELPYHVYLDTGFDGLTPVCQFHGWQALMASKEGRLLLILDEYERHRVILCEYADWYERQADIGVLLKLSGDSGNGTADGGVPAGITPVPPTLSARDAKPWPDTEN